MTSTESVMLIGINRLEERNRLSSRYGAVRPSGSITRNPAFSGFLIFALRRPGDPVSGRLRYWVLGAEVTVEKE